MELKELKDEGCVYLLFCSTMNMYWNHKNYCCDMLKDDDNSLNMSIVRMHAEWNRGNETANWMWSRFALYKIYFVCCLDSHIQQQKNGKMYKHNRSFCYCFVGICWQLTLLLDGNIHDHSEKRTSWYMPEMSTDMVFRTWIYWHWKTNYNFIIDSCASQMSQIICKYGHFKQRWICISSRYESIRRYAIEKRNQIQWISLTFWSLILQYQISNHVK